MNNVKITNCNGYDIEYIDTGEVNKETVVFAHGLGCNLGQWSVQIEHFKRNYRVIAFSLQGHGNSSKPTGADNYSLAQYAKTAIALLNKLKVKRCIWVGNSTGGVVGFEVIKNKPELIAKIITNGATPKLVFSKTAISLIRVADLTLIKLLKYRGYIRFMCKYTTKQKVYQEQLFNLMINSAPRAIVASRSALGNYNYLETIKHSSIPIYIIRCEYDTDINKSLKKVDQQLSGYKNVQIKDLKNAGHIANIDLPQEYNELLYQLINS